MSRFRILVISIVLRAYIAASLVAAAVVAPGALSLGPVLLLLWHLYLWWRPPRPVVRLLTDFFLYFAIALSFADRLGPGWPLLLSLPVLGLVTFDLEEAAAPPAPGRSRYRRALTRNGVALSVITAAALCLSLLLGSGALLYTSVAASVYLVVLFALAAIQLPAKPVQETPVQWRVVAGSQSEMDIRLANRVHAGRMTLGPPSSWVKLCPDSLPLKDSELTVKVALTPPLSGSSVVCVSGQATDRWGLTRVAFEVEPIHLRVVPRARYAAWLANKYLAETKPGSLPLISNVARLKPMFGLRRGVEYYGSRPYQPGDSIKNIDWKHTAVHRDIIVKQFAEFHGESAVVLANLAVASPEEADQVAYKVIVTALTLATESIPAALAAYDDKGVKLATALLDARDLVSRSLQLAMETVMVTQPERYLGPPDVGRLRANLARTRSGKSEASRVLAQLLQIEFRSLDAEARRNPATSALQAALSKVASRANIVVISQRNHDAEALAFSAYSYASKGHAVITV